VERIETSPRLYARLAGFLYLIVIVGAHLPSSSFAAGLLCRGMPPLPRTTS
jgi:hypothetical protein